MPPGRYSKGDAARVVRPEQRLLAVVAAHVDDDMLSEIAAADYGRQRDGCLAGLRVFRDEGVLLPPDPGVPWNFEVLELIRWSRPDRGDWLPGGVGERGHWMRLFCCIALVMRDVDMPQFQRFGSINEHLAPMLESIAALDPMLANDAVLFIEWAISCSPDSTDRAFLALADVLLECLRPSPDWQRLLASAHRLPQRIETAWGEVPCAVSETNGWLLGITHHDLSHDLWLPLIARLLLTPRPAAPSLVSAELETLGVRLLPATAARARRFGLPEPLVAKYLNSR